MFKRAEMTYLDKVVRQYGVAILLEVQKDDTRDFVSKFRPQRDRTVDDELMGVINADSEYSIRDGKFSFWNPFREDSVTVTAISFKGFPDNNTVMVYDRNLYVPVGRIVASLNSNSPNQFRLIENFVR